MEWAAILRDVVDRPADRGRARRVGAGLVLAGVSSSTAHPALAKLWGPLVGPLVAILSFVCSIGNVPLAAVLWNGGISFGGVIAFIFADLIILPILDIYRRYYGRRMAGFLLWTLLHDDCRRRARGRLLFDAVGLTPTEREREGRDGCDRRRLERDDRARPRRDRALGRARLALLQNGRRPDAADDGRAGRGRPRPRGARPPRALPLTGTKKKGVPSGEPSGLPESSEATSPG